MTLRALFVRHYAKRVLDPWLMDLSLKPHDTKGADIAAEEIARASNSSMAALAEMDRGGAAETMIKGGIKLLLGES